VARITSGAKAHYSPMSQPGTELGNELWVRPHLEKIHDPLLRLDFHYVSFNIMHIQ
jgi:hypothetical protein